MPSRPPAPARPAALEGFGANPAVSRQPTYLSRARGPGSCFQSTQRSSQLLRSPRICASQGAAIINLSHRSEIHWDRKGG